MPRGKVIQFSQEKGFGQIQLEDGTVMNFDASVASTFDIQPGDMAEVTVRTLGGRQVAMRVEFDKAPVGR